MAGLGSAAIARTRVSRAVSLPPWKMALGKIRIAAPLAKPMVRSPPESSPGKARHMPAARPVAAFILCWSAGAGAAAAAPQGAYAIDVALQIPNVGGPSWTATRHVCLDSGEPGAHLPVPVLSPNNPYGACTAERLVRTETELRYHIVCPGRDAARADVSYALAPDGFRGRIAMVLGAKNMTLIEYQTGHRLGDCGPAAAAAQP